MKWVRKFINYGIRCGPTVDNYMVCESETKLISRISFKNTFWLKIPSRFRKSITKKENKVFFQFNPSAISTKHII